MRRLSKGAAHAAQCCACQSCLHSMTPTPGPPPLLLGQSWPPTGTLQNTQKPCYKTQIPPPTPKMTSPKEALCLQVARPSCMPSPTAVSSLACGHLPPLRAPTPPQLPAVHVTSSNTTRLHQPPVLPMLHSQYLPQCSAQAYGHYCADSMRFCLHPSVGSSPPPLQELSICSCSLFAPCWSPAHTDWGPQAATAVTGLWPNALVCSRPLAATDCVTYTTAARHTHTDAGMADVSTSCT